MQPDVAKCLLDAAEACRAIEHFVRGFSFVQNEKNLLLRSGVERQFEILGEALRRAEVIDATLIEKLPDMRLIIGMRNRIIHGYDSVDNRIVWDAVQTHIPPLAAWLDAAAIPLPPDPGP